MESVNTTLPATTSSSVSMTPETTHLENRLRRMERRLHATWALSAAGMLSVFVLAEQPKGFAQTIGVTLTSLNNAVIALQARATALESKTASMTVVTDTGTNQPTVRFDNVNVQIYNSNGTTGRGNLIIGADLPADPNSDFLAQRTGTANLIIGAAHSYTGSSNLIAGYNNSVSGTYASISGGGNNTVTANYATVSGGSGNVASGLFSSVSGGISNGASGSGASISGGSNGSATGTGSAISGGSSSFAGNTNSWGVSTANTGSSNMFVGRTFSLPNN